MSPLPTSYNSPRTKLYITLTKYMHYAILFFMDTQTQRVQHTPLLPILNVVAYLATVLVNILSNVLPLNGRTAGEISDALPSYFTPTGYTFSIWGLIYLALLGFTVYQALPAQREARFQSQIGPLFIVSSLANIGWLFAWHYGFYAVSVLAMLTLLATLIAIYVRLDIGRRDASPGWQRKLLVHVPFSLYLGWITVATIANISSVANYLGWNGFGISGPTWSAIMMFAAVVIAGLLLLRRSDLAYAAVLVWALFGIRAAYPEINLIATSALVAAAVIALMALFSWFRSTRTPNASRDTLQGTQAA